MEGIGHREHIEPIHGLKDIKVFNELRFDAVGHARIGDDERCAARKFFKTGGSFENFFAFRDVCGQGEVTLRVAGE